MADFGWALYLLLAALLLYFWWQVRGASFDELLARSEREHHAVQKRLAKHPKGGAWRDYRRWRKAH
jgi:hypothetical protein